MLNLFLRGGQRSKPVCVPALVSKATVKQFGGGLIQGEFRTREHDSKRPTIALNAAMTKFAATAATMASLNTNARPADIKACSSPPPRAKRCNMPRSMPYWWSVIRSVALPA